MSDPVAHESPETPELAEGQTPATNERDRSRRQSRPTALLRERGLNFVNRMRNVGWLAGYSLPGDDHSFLLQQTNNIEQALKIQVSDEHVKLTRQPGRPMLVRVHVRGYRDEHGPQLSLHCIEMNKPSLLDLPAEEVWASGFGHGKDAAKILGRLTRSNFSPFDANGEIRDEYRQFIKSANAESGKFELDERAKSFIEAHGMLGEVLEASGGVIDSRLGRGQNYISVAGFVDSKAWVPATEHRKEYGLLMVRQHEDPERNIPVRIIGKMARPYFKEAREGRPILVEGSARRKVIPDDTDETKVKSRHCYIEATRISAAAAGQDIILPAPAWWSEIRDRLLARQAEAKARKAQAEAARPNEEEALEALEDAE